LEEILPSCSQKKTVLAHTSWLIISVLMTKPAGKQASK
jgi:hypothetical protein